MTKRELLERIEFESLLAQEAEGMNARAIPQWARKANAQRIARLLLRHGRTYARIQEAMCNGVEWSQYDTNESFAKRQARHEKWCETRDGQLGRRIKQLVAKLGTGFGVILGGDPRGCTVKLTVPSGKVNDFGREGICVPGA